MLSVRKRLDYLCRISLGVKIKVAGGMHFPTFSRDAKNKKKLMHLSSYMRDKEERGKQSTKRGRRFFFSLMTPHAIFSGEKCGEMQGFFSPVALGLFLPP